MLSSNGTTGLKGLPKTTFNNDTVPQICLSPTTPLFDPGREEGRGAGEAGEGAEEDWEGEVAVRDQAEGAGHPSQGIVPLDD